MYSLSYTCPLGSHNEEEHESVAQAAMRANILIRSRKLTSYKIRSPHGTLLEAFDARDQVS
jgi:hypothetical protein